VLRCLGFVRSQVQGAVAWQATTIAMLALILGVPLGIGLGRWAWALVADRTGVATDAATPLVALAVLAAAALAAANILAAAPAWFAARAHPARALRVE
jgi:putative ABC transport system permease protein